MSKNICVFLSKDSGILRIILSFCLRKNLSFCLRIYVSFCLGILGF